MKKTRAAVRPRGGRVLAFALLAFGVPALAEEWQSLFDGRTLAGWHVGSRPAGEGKGFWQVRDGAITCDSRGRPDHDYVWLVSDGEYGDFDAAGILDDELLIQFRDIRVRPLD